MLTEVVVFIPGTENLTRGVQGGFASFPGYIEDIIDDDPLVDAVICQIEIHIGAVNIFHCLVKACIEPLGIKGFPEKTKCLQIHCIILIAVISSCGQVLGGRVLN